MAPSSLNLMMSSWVTGRKGCLFMCVLPAVCSWLGRLLKKLRLRLPACNYPARNVRTVDSSQPGTPTHATHCRHLNPTGSSDGQDRDQALVRTGYQGEQCARFGPWGVYVGGSQAYCRIPTAFGAAQ